MDVLAIGLVVFSAVLHAGWNILGKSHAGSGVAFTMAASLSACLLLTPYLIWYLVTVGWATLPMAFWGLLLISGLAQMVYLVGLIVAYKHADVGVIYPIARALPVMMVGALSMLLGHTLTQFQWLGFVLITLGCMLVPLTGFRQFTQRSYFNVGVLWALVAALGTTGYSVIDKEALLLLTQAAGDVLGNSYSAIFYLGVQFWAMVLPVILWCVVTGNRQELQRAWKIRKAASTAGVMMASTYGLVLFAMTMTDNVSLVVALRQISIVMGLLMGVWFLAEKWHYTRGAGVVLILSGIVLTLGKV
ncbi:multidrug transporter [Vibrio fluvialis]|uniref:EamA family transporter n=1 Tax=Vibrio fluvialis TaxID=676 RepID=UPI001C9CACC6|nr:EamA family transporter [Vibrio fluvialis]ELK3678760.1 multidrug transporter [Vibrio fluvialis]ELS8947808.1 multidrug transporter [Vibrio fluvialis]MBY8118322.1 multidrug transporter [Vibrio fluvialis]MBY8260065.1 multidrug transporter [Vibrio fluvialis]MBY8301845.1 multidrug transporter [Vibrio fluvialis]